VPKNYVLIDFENVQPKNLSILAAHPFKVLVFIGASQTKVPRHVAVAMQALGDRAKYVEIDGNGPNALDFHIAYYIGELALAEIPNLQIPKKAKKDDKIDAIVKNLVNRGQSRPRKVKTLQNVISNLVSETLDEAGLAALVDELKKRKYIVVTKGNIKYTLPAG